MFAAKATAPRLTGSDAELLSAFARAPKAARRPCRFLSGLSSQNRTDSGIRSHFRSRLELGLAASRQNRIEKPKDVRVDLLEVGTVV